MQVDVAWKDLTVVMIDRSADNGGGVNVMVGVGRRRRRCHVL